MFVQTYTCTDRWVSIKDTPRKHAGLAGRVFGTQKKHFGVNVLFCIFLDEAFVYIKHVSRICLQLFLSPFVLF